MSGWLAQSPFPTPSAARVQLSDQTSTSSGAGSQTSYYQLNLNGTVHKKGLGGADVNVETWLLSGLNSDYEVMATATGDTGNLTGAGTGTWLLLSTTREWDLTDAVADLTDLAVTLAIQIRDKTTLAVLATATISLTANRTS